MLKLVLASGSPRRRELLSKVGIPFETAVSGLDENDAGYLDAAEFALAMARMKALDVAGKLSEDKAAETIVLGADTVVTVQGKILGKPANAQSAAEMLRALSDDWHDVVTGIALVKAGEVHSHAEYTHVKFRPLSDALIAQYIQTGEPMDKAGAYGIQGFGSLLVERIEGCYFNVMGLPLYRLSRMLETLGIEPMTWTCTKE